MINNPFPAYTKKGVSTDIAIVFSGYYSWTHGLGGVPDGVTCALVCQSAEYGYSAGHVILINPGLNGGSESRGLILFAGSTELSGFFMSAGIRIGRNDTQADAAITAANWKLRLRAWR